MPELPRLDQFAPIVVTPRPTPNPAVAGMVSGTVAQGAGQMEQILGHITAKDIELQKHEQALNARYTADKAAFNATNEFITQADRIRQGQATYDEFSNFKLSDKTEGPVLSGPIKTDHLMQAYGQSAKDIHEKYAKQLAGEGPLAQYAFSNEYTAQVRSQLQHLHTERDQRKQSELQQGFRDQVEFLTVKAGQRTATGNYDASDLVEQYKQLTSQNTGGLPNAASIFHPEQLQAMAKVDIPNIQAAPIRALIGSGGDGAYSALREIRNSSVLTPEMKAHLRTEAHTMIMAENAELTGIRSQQQYEDQATANKSFQSFIQNSLNPKTTLEDLDALLQQKTLKESLSWETGSLYDNAVSYVATLRERKRAQAHMPSDRATLIDVETGIYTGRMANGGYMRDIRDLNKYAPKLSDDDYKSFANILSGKIERRVTEAYTQAHQELNTALGVIPSVLNFDSKIADLAYDMKSEFNGLTRQLRDGNSHDPNAYLKISREVVSRYTPRLQSQMLISIQDRIANLNYKTPEEAAKALGGELSLQYRSWLIRYQELQQLLEQVPSASPKGVGTEKKSLVLPDEVGGGKK